MNEKAPEGVRNPTPEESQAHFESNKDAYYGHKVKEAIEGQPASQFMQHGATVEIIRNTPPSNSFIENLKLSMAVDVRIDGNYMYITNKLEK